MEIHCHIILQAMSEIETTKNTVLILRLHGTFTTYLERAFHEITIHLADVNYITSKQFSKKQVSLCTENRFEQLFLDNRAPQEKFVLISF